ncbi:MAG TPA: hypothetical protein VMU78_05945, partial [Methylocella sp.]|nr:hypothetical protein [Methylocella sp.]
FGAGEAASTTPSRAAIAQSRRAVKRAPDQILVADIPLPPQRPAELAQPSGDAPQVPLQAPAQVAAGTAVGAVAEAGSEAAAGPVLAPATEATTLPPRRPANAAFFAMRRIALPKLITGSQPILPPDFSAYADMDR